MLQRVLPIVGGMAVLLAAFFMFRCADEGAGPSEGVSNTIEYQGQEIKLRKAYSDFDEYKEDPNNLAAGEAEKVQRLVQTARIDSTFKDRGAMIIAVGDLRFPGYGSTSFGEKAQLDGSVLALFSIEIPQLEKDRYLLFQGVGGIYTLIDDFVHPAERMIGGVSRRGDVLSYVSPKGETVVERKGLR